MTRVDFYVSTTRGAPARERLACRIAGKAVGLGNRVHVHVADEAATERLDELLWTFNDISFLPHARPGADRAAPITFGSEAPPEPQPEVLINLAAEVPGFFSRFARVAEVVSGAPGERATGREHFRFYRDRGYPLQHHELRA